MVVHSPNPKQAHNAPTCCTLRAAEPGYGRLAISSSCACAAWSLSEPLGVLIKRF